MGSSIDSRVRLVEALAWGFESYGFASALDLYWGSGVRRFEFGHFVHILVDVEKSCAGL